MNFDEDTQFMRAIAVIVDLRALTVGVGEEKRRACSLEPKVETGESEVRAVRVRV